MRKNFTLFALLLAAVGANAAPEVYTWFGTSKTETVTPAGSNFFTVSKAGGVVSWSSGGKHHGTYIADDGTKFECADAVKMESATTCMFTTTRESKVIIVQTTSYTTGNQLKLDGESITGVANPTEGDVSVQVYTLESVKAGEHTISRVSETGLMYVKVELAELGAPQLKEPEITFDNTSGLVTIGAVENAVKVVYTTDGSPPDENSVEYTAPFTVEDATVVRAMAIGDGVNNSNSNFAIVEVWLVGQTVATPAFAQFNGTFALTCPTVNSAIEYSLDGGTTWTAYTMPVTLAEVATVKARANREEWTVSEIASEEIAVLPAVESTKTILMGYGSFVPSADNTVLGSKPGDAAEGFSLAIAVAEKTWGKGNKVTMGTESRTSMYGSNGAEMIMTVPEGLTVTRITFYSYLANVTNRNSGWDVVAGEQNTSADLVPMGSTDPENPDVRVFNIENGVGTITFKNTGERPNFTMAVDVVEAPVAPEAPALRIDGADFADATIDLGGENKTVTFAAADGVDIYYNFEKVADVAGPGGDEEPGVTALAEAAPTIEHEGKTYTLVPAEGVTLTEAGTLSYFAHDPATDLRSGVKTLAVTGNGDTTGIDEISVDNAAAPVEYFNLQGIRVDNPANGVFIRRQGNKVDKVIL